MFVVDKIREYGLFRRIGLVLESGYGGPYNGPVIARVVGSAEGSGQKMVQPFDVPVVMKGFKRGEILEIKDNGGTTLRVVAGSWQKI